MKLLDIHIVVIVLSAALIICGRRYRSTRWGMIFLWLGIASLLALASTLV